MATAVFRRVLGWLLGVYGDESAAHRLVVATPHGERHELGAWMVAITAALEGWNVTYLGADLPVEELLGAIGQTRAEAVGLSIVHAADFFFSSRRRHTRCSRDWSSDVCSSD